MGNKPVQTCLFAAMLILLLGGVVYSHAKKSHPGKRVELVETSTARNTEPPRRPAATGVSLADDAGEPHEGFIDEYGILFLGILTALSLFTTIGLALSRGKFAGWFKYHRAFAGITACLMLIHAAVAVLEHYFWD